MKKEKLMIWICSIAGIIAVMWYFNWINNRDQRLMQWAEAYERCVSVKYGSNPSAYYWEYDVYPECDTKPYLADPNLGKSQGSTYTAPSGEVYQLPY